MNKRCVIFAAAQIDNYEKVREFLRPDDFIIACDGGFNHVKTLGIEANLIIGDFDSSKKPEQTEAACARAKIIELPRVKDDTDTFYAIKQGLELGFEEFLFFGAIGNRFDHSLCNVSGLIYLYEAGKKAYIVDDYSVMEIIGNETVAKPIEITEDYAYFSLMNAAGDVADVTITGAKYNLDKAQIKASYQFGISNEVLPGKIAKVIVGIGKLLLVKIFK